MTHDDPRPPLDFVAALLELRRAGHSTRKVAEAINEPPTTLQNYITAGVAPPYEIGRAIKRYYRDVFKRDLPECRLTTSSTTA